MKHTELCYLTAYNYVKAVALIEYKTITVSEEPDVLVFDSYDESTLYEIKISKSDFNRDKDKSFRKVAKIERYQAKHAGKPRLIHTARDSLGNFRYYVCPARLINVSDLDEGWGLIWYYAETKRFRIQRDSDRFKCNKGLEQRLLTNALRRLAEGNTKNIITSKYKGV